MYYICKGEKVIGTCNCFPNVEDLQSRGEFFIKDNRNLNRKLLEVENGKIKEVKIMDSKKWYLSKAVWCGIVGVVIAAYNSASTSFGLPSIPDYIFGILGALGVYTRVSATTVIK